MTLEYPEVFRIKLWRRQVMRILATYVALLHTKKFLHYDLQWRNILVTKSPINPSVYLFDIPCGRVRKYFFRSLY